MSASTSAGSPTFCRGAATGGASTQENSGASDEKLMDRPDPSMFLKKSATVLSTSKFAEMNRDSISSIELNPMDKLLAKLSEQSAVINKQHEALKASDDGSAFSRTLEFVSTTGRAVSTTPMPETINASTAPDSSPVSVAREVRPVANTDEVLRLKLELEAAKGKIARMDQELALNKITKHTIDQAIGGASEADFTLNSDIPNQHLNHLQQSINTSNRLQVPRDNSWAAQDDTRSDTSDALSAGGFNRARAIWANGSKPGFTGAQSPVPAFQASEPLQSDHWMSRGFRQPFEPTMAYPAPPMNVFRGDRLHPDSELLMTAPAIRRNQVGGRFGRGAFPYASSNSSYDGYPPASAHYGSVGGMAGGVAPMAGPIGMGAGMNMGGNILLQAVATEGQTYLPTTEPLNYRRLLDRTVNCNWKYIVDKIVCNNDQQASIFLQQKLKVGTTEQKYDIVEAIVAQAYPLMVNRFGNFLVQRCFEHGTPEQVIKIAEAIRGNTLSLSMDAFGCHVVQKAFDSVPEDYKAIMVHELLRRIPETVIHRYACHVWQKLFELRWTESPPQIMKYVNEALRGMWHEVALGETGSLVVQNIFENCLEEDKRPCIEEVLASIDIVAHGQFGNWCIQHICEHGAPADRSRAIDHVIRYASEYSMDQFASKVVEKCLKIGGVDFLSRYLDRVCEGRLDRPRIPLIDIASDQYGNYLIQYILTHSNLQHREIVAQHIRKHMVSLRGSKFGSRVGMLCTNPAIQTRPGPGAGPTIGAATSRMPQQVARYGGAYR
ncbi:putative Meiotic coiled-coil protein 2 [Venustampulla echinocandica]|uniref:Putative Meiotic coiled-coil protein 2 n=1 Tax=Venustampulla echinocandica TaxID=2656787 RepID=A0A370TRQ5_9HELO|nr:putative Meiotic coiled-coil protein 2 [Venustampulla echinocandica]RDL38216.1 putative Meiotic coiled-coil protein 2 [Venustampulla echinocandica]